MSFVIGSEHCPSPKSPIALTRGGKPDSNPTRASHAMAKSDLAITVARNDVVPVKTSVLRLVTLVTLVSHSKLLQLWRSLTRGGVAPVFLVQLRKVEKRGIRVFQFW